MPEGGHGPDHPWRPKSLSSSTAREGGLPRANPPTSGGNPAMTQWMNPSASGSRTTSASSAVPAGTPVHASGGETSSPTHVYSGGIGCPSPKAGLVSRSVVTVVGDAALLAGAAALAPPPVPAATSVVEGAAVVEVVLADVVVWSELGARSSWPSSPHPASTRATAHVANTRRIGRVLQIVRAPPRYTALPSMVLQTVGAPMGIHSTAS